MHAINPSALTLFLFAVVLLASGQTDTTWVSQLSATLDTRLVDPDSRPYLSLFAIGLVAQFLFRVTLVTLASAGMLFLLASVYGATTGTYWFVDTGIPVAVFLGLHLLITDPATSPRNGWGRFLFGAFYGAVVFALYGLLDFFGEPLAYDKALLGTHAFGVLQRVGDLARGASEDRGYAGSMSHGNSRHRPSTRYAAERPGLLALERRGGGAALGRRAHADA